MQRALIQYRNPKNYALVLEALQKAGRMDLVGFGPQCLIRPPHESRSPRPRKRQTAASSARRSGPAQPEQRPADSPARCAPAACSLRRHGNRCATVRRGRREVRPRPGRRRGAVRTGRPRAGASRPAQHPEQPRRKARPQMTQPYDTIFFDLDGTLTDSAPGVLACVRYALDKLGVDAGRARHRRETSSARR